jgi:hypothetical protein
VVSTTDIYGRILGFLDRSRYFFFQVAPQLTHEAEWTPFQTHYFSENLVSSGNQTRSSGSVAITLTTRSQRRSLNNTYIPIKVAVKVGLMIN